MIMMRAVIILCMKSCWSCVFPIVCIVLAYPYSPYFLSLLSNSFSLQNLMLLVTISLLMKTLLILMKRHLLQLFRRTNQVEPFRLVWTFFLNVCILLLLIDSIQNVVEVLESSAIFSRDLVCILSYCSVLCWVQLMMLEQFFVVFRCYVPP